MINTPKSLRIQIALFGRVNVGKSSFLNMIANQDVAITSPIPGTTTDVVEKSMELLPIGPVTFLDTAGLDDKSELAEKRIERTLKILNRANVAVIVAEYSQWTDFERELINILNKKNIPFLIAFNKIDIAKTDKQIIPNELKNLEKQILVCSSIDILNRNQYVNKFKDILLDILPQELLTDKTLVRDLIPENATVILIIPIDKEAPKGRLILPQVQTIRDILDGNSTAIMLKETEYVKTLNNLKKKPDLVICDSQVVDFMVENTPTDIACTTFSILFSRYKGDLSQEIIGAAALSTLKPFDKVLIAEACSHHPNEDDIGRVKIPKWMKMYLGHKVQIDVFSGRDYPDDLNKYKVIIHCGGCMLTRNEKLRRIEMAVEYKVPITNYGIAISLFKGVLERVLQPFKEEYEIFKTLTKHY